MTQARRKAADDVGAGGVLFLIHCQSNEGYAIEKQERTFFDAALTAGFRQEAIYFSYPSLQRGKPRWMPEGFSNVLLYDVKRNVPEQVDDLTRACAAGRIHTALAYDLQPNNPANTVLRRAGIRRIVSYWGAPMSSPNRGTKLMLKRLEVALRRHGPDLYVFQSRAMEELAIHGRGIPARASMIIPTGVDTERFDPECGGEDLAEAFDIPPDRKVFVFAGHMEPRKGVHVIVEAMDRIVGDHGREDIHFLVFGDRPGEQKRFYEMLRHERTRQFITFGGYQDGLERIFPQAYAGIVASSGWDSWPISALEMASSGLPLLVSDLQGLKEIVEEGVNGRRFPPGDCERLASLMMALADDEEAAARLGRRARETIEQRYSRKLQVERMAAILRGDTVG